MLLNSNKYLEVPNEKEAEDSILDTLPSLLKRSGTFIEKDVVDLSPDCTT
jgi:hypothetical protein